jgi:hypothetical protein
LTLKYRLWLVLLAAISKIRFLHGLRIYTVIYRHYANRRGKPPALRFRELFDTLQKNSPFTDNNLQGITLGIVCHPKDFNFLQYVIEQARKHSKNPINEVVIVTTKEGYKELTSRFPQYVLRNEENVFPIDMISRLRLLVPPDKLGWVLQQLIKFHTVLNARNNATLILDADTILIKDRTFIDSYGIQSLSYSHEYHRPYAVHFSKFFKLELDRSGHSYVTHHQLMQKDIVAEMFGSRGENLEAWAKAADYKVFSPLCEYHCYGEFMARRYPNSFRIVRWGNIPIKSSELDQILKKGNILEVESKFKNWQSISAHSYL